MDIVRNFCLFRDKGFKMCICERCNNLYFCFCCKREYLKFRCLEFKKGGNKRFLF